jgi:hypothetical protein
VEVRHASNGSAVTGYEFAVAKPLRVDGTRLRVSWAGAESMPDSLLGSEVVLVFELSGKYFH